MNKKAMALAVAGALAAPGAALAQVQIGGGLTVLYFSHDPDNKPVGQTTDVMQSSESELRISSVEKLGGGNEIWFQCNTSLDGFIQGAATTSNMCGRNSALGFRGSFGNVFLGNWDTPTKLLQNRVRGWFSGTNPLVGGGYTLMAGGAASGAVNGQTVASFYRRQADTVNYHSPNWSGFSLAAAFSAANEAANIPDSTDLKPRLYGLNAVYATGPLWAGVSYEAHTDYNPGAQGAATYSGGGTDNNMTIGAGYTFMGTLNVRGTYSSTKYETTNTGGELKVKGYGFYGDWQVSGPHAIHLAYITIDDTEGTTGGPGVGLYKTPGSQTAASVITVAYSYDVSKRTQLFFAYNQMDNDNNANFSQGVTVATLGNKQSSVGLGIKHSF